MENSGSPLIRVCELKKIYVQGKIRTPVLNGINLSVMQGEYVGIIGKSGAGKTTLVNMLGGLDDPTEGDIEIGGTHIQQLNEVEKARWRGTKVGVIFQSFQLIPGLSLIDNILLPADFTGRLRNGPNESREKAASLLETVGLADHMLKRPAEISGGQQQRVAIARALINDPEILLADEPTGRLDSATSATIFDLFDRVVDAGTTVVLVSHERSLAQRTKRIIRLAESKLIEESDGNHSGRTSV